jgi:hypothetical protein
MDRFINVRVLFNIKQLVITMFNIQENTIMERGLVNGILKVKHKVKKEVMKEL